MSQTTLSICVPAYNAGDQLGRCLDSVMAQWRPGIEVIVVDDGSTDDTAKIAEAYGERHGHVCVLRQANQGAGVARNTAIDNARGRWIVFVDSDDMLLDGAVDAMWRYIDSDLDVITMYTRKGTQASASLEIVRDMDQILRRIHDDYPKQVTPWAKMYSRKFLDTNAIRFPQLGRSEDFIFNLRCLNAASAIGHVNTEVYDYQYSDNGLTWSYNPGKMRIIDQYMRTLQQEMPKLTNLSQTQLHETYLVQAYDQIYCCLHQIAYHAKNRWGRKRRYAFLRELLAKDWAQEALKRPELMMPYLGLGEFRQYALADDLGAIDRKYKRLQCHDRRGIVIDRLTQIPVLRQIILHIHNRR